MALPCRAGAGGGILRECIQDNGGFWSLELYLVLVLLKRKKDSYWSIIWFIWYMHQESSKHKVLHEKCLIRFYQKFDLAHKLSL
jgi:hypothetical protein